MKKRLVTLLIAATMVVSLVGCGSTNNNESSNNSTMQESSVEKQETLVLVDNEVMKITYTGYKKDSVFGYKLNLEIENKTANTITVQTREVSVDGVMVEPIFSCDIAAGKKAKDSMTISEEYVKEIVNIEGLFHVFDGSSWEQVGDYSFELLKSNETSSKNEKSGEVLVDNEIVKIEYLGMSDDSIFGPTVKIRIENKTSITITVQTREVAVNGIMKYPIFSSDIAGGKKANDTLTFDKATVETINNLEGKFVVIEGESLDSLGEYDFSIAK